MRSAGLTRGDHVTSIIGVEALLAEYEVLLARNLASGDSIDRDENTKAVLRAASPMFWVQEEGAQR